MLSSAELFKDLEFLLSLKKQINSMSESGKAVLKDVKCEINTSIKNIRQQLNIVEGFDDEADEFLNMLTLIYEERLKNPELLNIAKAVRDTQELIKYIND